MKTDTPKSTFYGDIPSDWKVRILRDICVPEAGVQTGPFGSQLHQRDYQPIGTPIITVEHLGDNRILHLKIPLVSDFDLHRLSRYKMRTGDIIFSRVGSVDRSSLVRKDEDGWLFSGRCLRVRPNNDLVSSEYLSWFFALPTFKEHIRNIAVGATMPSINTEILSGVQVVVPPLPEQRSIARILGALDDKIELNQRMNHTLEEMAQAIFKSWFVDFDPVVAKAEGRQPYGMNAETAALFPAELVDSELGAIPKGWKVGKISDLALVTSGKRPGERSTDKTSELQVPLFGGGGIMAYVREPLYSQPILITGRVGTIGQVFRIPYPCWASDNTLVLHAKTSDQFEYVYFHLLGVDFDGITRGSTQPLVTQSDIQGLKIVLGPEQIVHSFHNIACLLLAKIDKNNIESATLAAIRDALLPKLLSGDIRIKQAEKFVEQKI